MKSNNRLILILLAFQCLSFASSQKPVSPYWWQIELRISASGEYAFRDEDKAFDGNYSFTSVILGAVHEDDDDYVFIQVHQETSEIKWKESIFDENSRREFDLSEKIKPEITFNYISHNKEAMLFDFDSKPISVPHKCSIFPAAVKQIPLPVSAGDDFNETRKKYKKGVIFGSHRVTVTDRDIYDNNEIKRVFEWNWENKTGDSSWINRHHTKVTLKILRMLKKEKT
jgi:hypothetical protein